MKKILVLCGSNSCRSQMAEGYLKFYAHKWVLVESAGLHQTKVHPLTLQVMQEDSIDITEQVSRTCDEFANQHFDFLITLCDEARSYIPNIISYDQHLHFEVPDPTTAQGSPTERLTAFRKARELVKKQMLRLIGSQLIEEEPAVIL